MDEERQLEIFQYRAGLFLGSIAYPFFGWFSETFLKVNYDTLALRLPIAIFCAFFLVLSFKINFVKKHLRIVIMFGSCWAMHDYIVVFAQSNYHFYFSIGLTAMPFIIFTYLFHPIDLVIFFTYMLAVGVYTIKELNVVFVVTYLILMVLAFTVYLFVTRSRLNLLKRVKDNLVQIKINQNKIDEKNRSLIKIGKLATQVAHDIRSPVTALEAVSQMLGNEIDPKKKRLIENAAKRINDIANNLVSEYRENLTQDLSSFKIDRTVSLNSLIDDIVEEKKLSLDSNHRIIVRAPESIGVPENLNPTEFQRMISNLINNSIESFDKENGIVDIELYRKENKIKLTIRDNGKGIRNDKISKVFEKGISGKEKGAGLGLSHAKEYIESLEGSITLESVPTKETRIIIII